MALTYDINIGGSTLSNGDKVTLLKIENNINSQYQSATINYNGDSPSPSINDSVSIDINGTTVFYGYVSRIDKDLKGIKVWKLQCIGKTYDLWREYIDDSHTHSFSNAKTSYMISSLISDYSDLTFPQSDDIGQQLSGEYDFEDMCLGDAIKKINSFDSYNFYVNGSDELIYYKPNTTQSLTVTESNLIEKSKFEESDDELYNRVLVKGDGVSYTSHDAVSESNYGKHFLKVSEQLVNNESDAQTLAESYVNEYKDPVLYGSVTIRGDESVSISQQFTLSLTNLGISETPKIVSYVHTIDKKGFRTKIQFGRESYEPAKEFEFLRRSQSNVDYGVYKALADAASAEAAADGKINSYWYDDSSSILNPQEGDIWFDTDDGNKIYRYNSDSSTWVEAQDSDIAIAMASASTAQSTADGKVTTWYCAPFPTSTEVSLGDLWWDTSATDDDPELYRANKDNASTYSDWDDWTGWTWSHIIDDDGNKPSDGATGNHIYYQSDTPDASDTPPPSDGDIWVKTPDRIIYIYDSGWQQSSWSEVNTSDLVGTIATEQIQDNAITIDQIHDDAINRDKLVDGEVITDKLDDLAITLEKIADNAISGTKIMPNGIKTQNLQVGCVQADQIDSLAVNTDKLAANAITADKILAGEIKAVHITSNAIESNHIDTDTIKSEHIDTDAITANHIDAGTITADEIATHTLTSDEIDTLDLDTDQLMIGNDCSNPLMFDVVDDQARIYPQNTGTCDLGIEDPGKAFRNLYIYNIAILNNIVPFSFGSATCGAYMLPWGSTYTNSISPGYFGTIGDIGTASKPYVNIYAEDFVSMEGSVYTNSIYPGNVGATGDIGTSSSPYVNIYAEDFVTVSPNDPKIDVLKNLKDYNFNNKNLPDGVVNEEIDEKYQKESGDTKPVKTVNLGNMTSYLLSVCKEQEKIIENNKSEIDDLKEMILILNNKVELMEGK